MIVDKILNNALITPHKEAILYEGIALSYSELAQEIRKAESYYNQLKGNLFFLQKTAIENIIDLLALNKLRKSGIVIPLDMPQSQIQEIKNKLESKELGQGIRERKNRFLGILSSGSTGEPKVIWKTNANWEKAFSQQSEIFGIGDYDRVFVLDAMAYSANLNTALHTLWQGATLVLGKLSKAKSWNEEFIEKDISSFFLVPSHCRLLSKFEINTQVKSIVTAGEKLDRNTTQSLISNFPDALITEYYGAAELGHISFQQNEDVLLNPHSVGKAFPNVKITIKDNKISVFSPYVSPDYKAIASVNDLGYFEGENLILQGRVGRMFNRRGLNIYAQEIENVAVECVFVKTAVLVKPEASTKLILYFTAYNPSEERQEQLLVLFLKEKLSKAKQPSYVKKIREFPHSEAGKIDFRALSKMSSEKAA